MPETVVKFGVGTDTIRKALQRGEIRNDHKKTTVTGGRKKWWLTASSFRERLSNRPKLWQKSPLW